jgi:archaeal type IV pilus assembly protein PilA
MKIQTVFHSRYREKQMSIRFSCKKREKAVSSVISEVLLIALVLIMVPAVTVSLLNQLPEDRVSTVTIKMGTINSVEELHLYHKGGDWIKKENLKIMCNGVEDESWKNRFSNQTFDLGDNLPLSHIKPGTTVSLVAKNSVIFTGVATYER